MGSIAVGVVVLGLKYLAAHVTGSVALLSDALESIVNVVTAVAALVAVRLSARPANAALPYGYHKAEYFSAVAEGIFIVIAALAIFHQAWKGITTPVPIDAPALGLLINGAATVLNAGWCWVLISQGRKLRSPALEADGHHLLTDVFSSLGVIGGLGLAILTGWYVLDAVIAVIVGIVILVSGSRLIASSVGGLMDVALPAPTREQIGDTIRTNAAGALQAHDVRTRQAGRMTFIDFHLVVPGTMAVEEAHAICDRIEGALKADHPESLVTIHVEPEDKAKRAAIVVA
ncbi:cation diffusion facilitator family transporter [Pelagibacterium montanilacus]|uniref:cation diffusion facilitator family transporter n=1 Tax=Pelagibacterium montanilacus TaxID=2185280 RepID=UPI000F8F2ADD|nr:cation diffusion facilitator family transporter [Pelagibacterium montanilacus]